MGVNENNTLLKITKHFLGLKKTVSSGCGFANWALVNTKMNLAHHKEHIDSSKNRSNKKQNEIMNLAHALNSFGFENDLSMGRFLTIIEQVINNTQIEPISRTKKLIEYATISNHFFELNPALKDEVLTKVRPYIQNKLDDNQKFNMFMGVLIFDTGKQYEIDIIKYKENNQQISSKLSEAIDQTFDFKLHQFQLETNYYFHAIIAMTLFFKLYEVTQNPPFEIRRDLNYTELSYFLISNLIIWGNRISLSKYNGLINAPANPNGTASHTTRMFQENPKGSVFKSMQYILQLSMCLCFKNNNSILNLITLLSLAYTFKAVPTSAKYIHGNWGKIPLPFSLQKLGISCNDFLIDMSQTERSWTQQKLFNYFTKNEFNQFTLTTNTFSATSWYELILEYGINALKHNRNTAPDFGMFRHTIINFVKNIIATKQPQSPVQEISQLITCKGILTITDIQKGLYLMLRTLLTDSIFCVENASFYVKETEVFANSLIKSIRENVIKELQTNRSNALAAEILDGLKDEHAINFAHNRIRLLFAKSFNLKPSETDMLEQLKNIFILIQKQPKVNSELQEILACFISDFENYSFKEIINIFNCLFNDLGKGEISQELVGYFKLGKDHPRLKVFKKIFESMSYICHSNSLSKESLNDFLKLLVGNNPRLKRLLSITDVSVINNWEKQKSELIQENIPEDIIHEIDQFLTRHSSKQKNKLDIRKQVLNDMKHLHHQIYGIWPGQLKGLILAITETSGSTLIQLGKIPKANQINFVKTYYKLLSEKLKNSKPESIQKIENLIEKQLTHNRPLIDGIPSHHLEHWLLEVENMLLVKLANLKWGNKETIYNEFCKFLELMDTCINQDLLTKAVNSNFNLFPELPEHDKTCLKSLQEFESSTIWNSNIAYLLQNWLNIKQNEFITEFLSKAGAVPYIIGRQAFHMLGLQSKEMSRVLQTDNVGFCNDHSQNTFRPARLLSENLISVQDEKKVSQDNFHNHTATFGYARKCPLSKTTGKENRRSCPGKLLPYHEISSTLNIAALTGVVFEFYDQGGIQQDFNSADEIDYNDSTLALSPKGQLITNKIEQQEIESFRKVV